MTSDGNTKRAGSKATGRVEEKLGWATGDRRVEAEGAARRRKSAERGPDAPLEPAEVDREEKRVRRAHRDTR